MMKYNCSFCGEEVRPLSKDKKGVMIHNGRPYTHWSALWTGPIICSTCVGKIKMVMDKEWGEGQTS